MSDNNENMIEFLRNQQTATVCFCQPSYVSRMKELAERFPDKCQITAENNDGSIVAHIPRSWVKINPPRRMTEEQRQELTDRLGRVRPHHRASEESKSHENISDDKIID